MAKLLKLRRGNTSQHGSFTGAEGEVTVDTDKETLVVHNGSTAGGFPVLRATGGSQNLSTSGTAATGALTVTGNIAVSGTVDGVDLQTLNTAVSANTSKVTNATHTGDVTGATSLTIASGAVTTAKIAADAVDGTKIADDSIDSEHYADGSIDTAHISNDAIIGSKIADDAIESEHYADTSIDTAHISNDAFTSLKIADDAVGADQLASSAVVTASIVDDAVTYTKIQNVAQDRILGRQSSGTGVVEELNAANVRTMLNVEDGATGDQTASEILTLLGDQNIYTTGVLGRDSGDYIGWIDNAQLDVYINGNNEFRFEADGDFHADGDVIAYSTTTASDENLKKDITTVTDAVAKVEALKGVTFTWKKNDNTSAGVIAQDVEKVLPQVVKTVSSPNGDEYKAVNYGGLTSILIEAIKDLSARVKVLEAK